MSGPCFTFADSEKKKLCDCRSGKFQVHGSDYADKLVFCEHCKHDLWNHKDGGEDTAEGMFFSIASWNELEGTEREAAQSDAQLSPRESPAEVNEPAAPSDDEQEKAIREIGVP